MFVFKQFSVFILLCCLFPQLMVIGRPGQTGAHVQSRVVPALDHVTGGATTHLQQTEETTVLVTLTPSLKTARCQNVRV